jgi:plasmid stabilization system protein ParE
LTESLYDISAQAQDDLFEIWRRIARDSVDLANRIEKEFDELFIALGRMPAQGPYPERPYREACAVFSDVFISNRVSIGHPPDPHHGGTSRPTQSEAASQEEAVTETRWP